MLLWAACLWVVAATVVALLPMRLQFVPGVVLLGLAPVLIVWLGLEVAWWAGVLGLIAFVSMFRHPLRYFWARARGMTPEVPREVSSELRK